MKKNVMRRHTRKKRKTGGKRGEKNKKKLAVRCERILLAKFLNSGAWGDYAGRG